MSEEENNNVSDVHKSYGFNPTSKERALSLSDENNSDNDGNFDKFYNDYKEKKDVAIAKPRRKMPPKSQKQLESFERVRKIREQRVIERHKIQEESNKEKRDIEKLYREFIKDKLKKPIEKEEEQEEELEEQEPKPIIIKKKSKAKPKQIIIEESEEEEPEPIIIRRSKPKSKQRVIINDPKDNEKEEEINYLRERDNLLKEYEIELQKQQNNRKQHKINYDNYSL